MIPLCTAEEIRTIDRRVIGEYGIPPAILMERAGVKTAEIAARMLDDTNGSSVAIFCGKGNNGGDGFVIARELANRGFTVRVFLFGNPRELKGDALANHALLEKLQVPVTAILEEKDVRKCGGGADLAIDALLGTGVTGPPLGILKKAVGVINRMICPVLSVDVPTGVNTDTGECPGECVHADVTVTMGVCKRGLMLYPGRQAAGHVITVDIGFPPAAVEEEQISVFEPDDFDIWSVLPARVPVVNKTQVGKILILAGSAGMTGAAALTAKGALRAGAGLVVVGIPKSLNPILEVKLTEALTLPLEETPMQSLGAASLETIRKQLSWASVLAMGPGLSRHSETIELVRSILSDVRIPLVLDADALFALSPSADHFPEIASPCVITPHEGELARLMDGQADEIRRDRVTAARKTADALGVTVLLKGAPTIVATPEGSAWVNPTGNAGLASGGSGDVLTGIIAGFLGQGMRPEDAAVAGAYLHGRAADIVADRTGELALIAGDIPTHLAEAFQSIIPHSE